MLMFMYIVHECDIVLEIGEHFADPKLLFFQQEKFMKSDNSGKVTIKFERKKRTILHLKG